MSEDIRIEQARDTDAAGLMALIEPIYAEYDGVIFDVDEMPELRAIATSFRRQGGLFWCAFDGERLVGSVGWVPAGKGIELRKLYVARYVRRRGLGDRLATLVEETARQRGAAFVELWSDVKFTPAHGFYEARGYRRDGTTRALHDRSDTIEYYFRLDLLSWS